MDPTSERTVPLLPRVGKPSPTEPGQPGSRSPQDTVGDTDLDGQRFDRRSTDGAVNTTETRVATTNKRLWLHAIALAMALIAILAIMRPSAVVIPDEGLYLAQADALTNGDWSVQREATDLDREGEFSRLSPEMIVGDREIPYGRHASYPLVITPAYWLAGYLGAIALSVLGLWGAAVNGAFIARRIDKRLGVATLWLIGFGSPLLFYGFVTMGHALAAAAAGTAFLGLSKWLDDRNWTGLAFGLPALLFTVLLRSEGTIYALAVVAAIGLMPLPARGTRRFDRRAFLTAGALGVAVLTTYFSDTRIALAVLGRDGCGVNPGRIVTRVSADPVWDRGRVC